MINFLKKKFLSGVLIILFIGIILELFSFFFSYFNLFPISSTPKLYSKSTYYNFRNEKNIWGAWHKKNLKIRHKTRCFDAVYETNSIGAKDYEFRIKKSQKKRFILLGDSFAEGFGVGNNFTFKSHLEKSLNSEIYNFGSSGALGPLQYYLIYQNLAKKYEHDSIIISFLPANDFNENDYNLWKKNKWNLTENTERYRPYYLKKNSEFDFFIPKNAKKRENWYFLDDQSFYKKIKNLIKDSFWSFNVYRSIIFIKNYKYKSSVQYSGYFDATMQQQEAAIYFISKILKSRKFDTAAIIIFPSKEDLKRINLKKDHVYNQKWFKELKKLKSNLDYELKLIDIAKYVKDEKEYQNYLHDCDDHLNKNGNKFVAKKIYQELIN